MKIQLDTEAKTIKLDSTVQFDELITFLEKLLPKGEWKKFKLETNTVIYNWSDPIKITTFPYQPSIYWNGKGITYFDAKNNLTLCAASSNTGGSGINNQKV